jgi:quercetin dioxygenase-like cupin family protein
VQFVSVSVLSAVVGVGLFAAFADVGQGKAFPSVERALTQSLDDQPGQEVRMDVVTFPPGAKSPDHRHPGHVFVYVLEGVIETRVGGGELTRYKAGDAFYEPANAVHADSRNPSDTKTARILAVMIAEEGEPSLRLAH